jgi:pyruvate dehydrogenase E1 component beta subunit
MFREALNEALKEEMRRDPAVIAFGLQVAARGGSHKVTKDILEEFGPKRIFDTPIAEASFTGMGVGAAITGMRPVVEIMFLDFSMLILDQIINQAAKYEFMTGGTQKVPMVLRAPGGIGNGLAAQHSQSLEAIFYHIPGLKLVMPSTPYDAKGLFKSAIRDDEPVIFLEHKQLYMTQGEVPQEEYLVPLGKGDIKRSGSHVTVIAWSSMVPRALAAAEQLEQEGIDVEVLDPRSLVPLDRQLILESVRKTEHVVIVQEAVRRGGVASDISSIITEKAFDYLDAPVRILAGVNTPIPFNLKLEKHCVPQVEDIVTGVKETLVGVQL